MAGKSSTKPKPKQVEVKNPKDDEPKYEKIPTLKEMAVVFLITSVFAAIAALLVAATQDGLVKFATENIIIIRKYLGTFEAKTAGAVPGQGQAPPTATI